MRRGWSQRVVHDLRNPAATLRTAAYLLRHAGSDDEDRRNMLDLVDRQSARLLQLLDELADGFAAEHDAMALRREPLDLADLQPAVAPGAAAFDAQAPLSVEGDPTRLTQLLRLLRELRLGEEPVPLPLVARADRDRVRLHRVLRAQPQLLAEPDALLHMPLPQNLTDGLGLALPIAAAIARAHGGELRIERAADDDSALVVRATLPVAQG